MSPAKESSLDAVRDYYADFGEREWDRLASPEDGAIEYAITCRALSNHLPQSGRVLDIGGGPGRYSIWLAERGYQVVLADLSPELIDIAKTKVREAKLESKVESMRVADARDLSDFDDNSFDAVLSLGPFYHLTETSDRERAAEELVRVLKPRSPAFVALMPTYSLLRRTLAIPDEREHILQDDWLNAISKHGVFSNSQPGRFNHGFGIHPTKIAPFFRDFELELVELLGVQSLGVGIQSALAEIARDNKELFEKALDLLEKAASDPSIHGLCSHLLYIGRKVE